MKRRGQINGKRFPQRAGTIERRSLENDSVPPMDDAQKIELYETLISTRCGSPILLEWMQTRVKDLRAQLVGQTPAAN